jgi:hypothetical protein
LFGCAGFKFQNTAETNWHNGARELGHHIAIKLLRRAPPRNPHVMKLIQLLLLCSFSSLEVIALDVVPTGATAGAEPRIEQVRVLEPRVKERGEHHRIWQTVRILTNSTTGIPSIHMVTNEYHELGSGICYKTADGTWVDSKPQLTIAPDGGAQAMELGNKVYLRADINSQGALQISMEDGQKISATFRGLFLFDPSTERRFLVSLTTNSIGVILPPNRLVYSNCFVSIRGDLSFKVTPGGLEQDVVLRESLSGLQLEELGLDPRATVLEAWTEFFDAPVPEAKTNQFPSLANELGELQASSLDDQSLRFGRLYMREGRAFLTQPAAVSLGGSRARRDSIPVGKCWREYEDGSRRFLIESVRWKEILPHLDRLNGREGTLTNAALSPSLRTRELSHGWVLPKLLASISAKPVQVAANSSQAPAFVIDFILDQNTYDVFTFEPNLTYCVGHPVTINHATLRGGTVIKMAEMSGSGAGLAISGTLTCDTGPGRMAIITAVNDNSIGEWISGSTGNIGDAKYGAPALGFSYNAAVADVKYVRISHADEALVFGNTLYANTQGSNPNKVRHSQFVNCWRAITCDHTRLVVQNSLFHAMDQVFAGTSCTIYGEHVTAHNAWLLGDYGGLGSSITLVNSIVVGIANSDIAYSLPPPSVEIPDDSPVFESVLYGAHYLPANSNFRQAGVNSIDSELRAALRNKTTRAPVLLPGGSQGGMTLAPVIPRDEGIFPDLGYHYDILDYAGHLSLQGGSVFATNGVIVGGTIRLAAGTKVISHGNVVNLNGFLDARAVQEQTGAPVSFLSTFYQEFGSAVPSEVRLRFTQLATTAGPSYHIYRDGGSGEVAFLDCQIVGGGIAGNFSGAYDHTIGLTNSLFEFSKLAIAGSSFTRLQAWNNTFIKGSITLSGGNYSWAAQANLFDDVTLSAPSFYSAYNAFYLTTQLSGSYNVPLLSPVNYQTGPLGTRYLPSGSTPLLNTGGRSPIAAGLYHHTTQISQFREGQKAAGLNVDIGFHYVAMINGRPYDSDNDGRFDVIEDANGNNTTDPFETAHNDPDTDDDSLSDGSEVGLGLDPFTDQRPVTGMRRNYLYNLNNRVNTVTGKGAVSLTYDAEGNIKFVNP